MGNYLGDMVRGAEIRALPPAVQRGIDFHRAIDRLTDTHPAVKALNAQIAPRHGRYASVLTDIGFDYCLSQNWDELMSVSYAEFSRDAYATILAYRAYMPARAARQATAMVEGRWLRLYQSQEGMNEVFTRLRRRLSRPEMLDGVERLLPDFAEEFNRTFLTLFPELQTLAHGYRSAPTDSARP